MRTKHEWKVTLQAETGEIVERKVRAYWDPAQDGCSEAIMEAARAEAWWECKKAKDFQPIAAALVAA